jgi:hypothetical protein
MRKLTRNVVIAAFTFGLAAPALADDHVIIDRDGPAERAGEKIDDAADKAESDVHRASHKTKKGAKRAKKKAGKELEDAGKDLKD